MNNIITAVVISGGELYTKEIVSLQPWQTFDSKRYALYYSYTEKGYAFYRDPSTEDTDVVRFALGYLAVLIDKNNRKRGS